MLSICILEPFSGPQLKQLDDLQELVTLVQRGKVDLPVMAVLQFDFYLPLLFWEYLRYLNEFFHYFSIYQMKFNH